MGCFKSSFYETLWSLIRVKDARINDFVDNLSNYSKYLLMSPLKTSIPPGISGNCSECLQGLPFLRITDKMMPHLFHQMWKLAGLVRVSYTAFIKSEMLFISGHQRSAHIIFRCTTFPHVVYAICWLKATIMFDLTSFMPVRTSPWKRFWYSLLTTMGIWILGWYPSPDRNFAMVPAMA